MNSWGSGYQLNVTVSNNGSSTVSGWNIEIGFASAPQMSGSWNVDISESGNSLFASDIGWNGNIGSGQSVSFGVLGNSNGNISTPNCSVQ